MIKTVGWIIKYRPTLSDPWRIVVSTFSPKSEQDCIDKYTHRDKVWLLDNGFSVCVPLVEK